MDNIIQAREMARKVEWEVLEYVGGQYDPGLIKSAEMILIVVPEKVDDDGSFIVGKGQWGEAHINPAITKVFNDNAICDIVNSQLLDKDNYKQTGKLFIKHEIEIL